MANLSQGSALRAEAQSLNLGEVMRRTTTLNLFVISLMLMMTGVRLIYATWANEISVDGTVHTASMSARWLTNAETAPLSNAAVCIDTVDVLGIGSIAAHRDPGDPTLTHVTIENAYPGYEANCALRWRNDGDVWIMTDGHQINGLDSYGGVYLNLDEGHPLDEGDDVFIQFSNGAAPTAPGSGGTDSLTVLVLDTATPGATLEFHGTHSFKLVSP